MSKSGANLPTGPQKMTPSEAFVETMVANKVKDIFGIMGSAFMDAMDIFAPAGIRLIPVVHEQGAAHMADGYARVSGSHGVVIGQNGPGISNCVTAIAAAYWAHSPVVIITPETGTMGMGLGGFQEANQLPMFEEFTKYQGHVNNPKRMAEFTGRCFDRALSEMGPTQLNIPRDYFYGEIEVEIPQPNRLDRGPGGEKSLDEAAELLANAKFPVIISGGGVVMGDAVEECKAFAERLGAPVVNSYLHNDSFPASHPLWCGPLGYQGSKAAMKLMAQADVVVALGSRLGPFGTLPQHGMDYWPKNAKIIQIDADNKMLGLVKKISVGICGDAKAAAVAKDHPEAWVIGSDQVADLCGAAIGKPGNFERAMAQLQLMRGATVTFQTALCLMHGDVETTINIPTEVTFRKLSDDVLEAYLHAEEPYDCAGSAKSEGLGISLLESIKSDDPTALIGLPLIALSGLLRDAGFVIPAKK
mgnify:CR=1 FL=1